MADQTTLTVGVSNDNRAYISKQNTSDNTCDTFYLDTKQLDQKETLRDDLNQLQETLSNTAATHLTMDYIPKSAQQWGSGWRQRAKDHQKNAKTLTLEDVVHYALEGEEPGCCGFFHWRKTEERQQESIYS